MPYSHHHQNQAPILVFDIETIPDVATAKKVYHLPDGSDADLLQALLAKRAQETNGQSNFMKVPLHKIVCLSFLWIDAANNQYTLKSLTAQNMDEKEIINTFLRAFNKNPILVSWNGTNFDLPVLMYRAMLHNLCAPAVFGDHKDSYSARYSNKHVDVMEKLSHYQFSGRQKLDLVSVLCGFAGKQDTDGNDVLPMIQNEQWDLLSQYCESDVLNTWFVFLRWSHLVGKINTDAMNFLQHQSLMFLKTLKNNDGIVRHQSFLDNISDDNLPDDLKHNAEDGAKTDDAHRKSSDDDAAQNHGASS